MCLDTGRIGVYRKEKIVALGVLRSSSVVEQATIKYYIVTKPSYLHYTEFENGNGFLGIM